jgi:hypothetical protein
VNAAMKIRLADQADLPAVLSLLTERAAWLRERGSRQWSGDLLSAGRIAGIIANRGTYLAVAEDATPLGTITLSSNGDPDFWTGAEKAEPALYVSKMATSLGHGRGLGAPLLRWAVDKASIARATWVRLDVIRDPEAARLRQWYADQGFEYLRDAVVAAKNSGALFQRRAAADPDAAMLFCPAGTHDERWRPHPGLAAGTRVAVDYYGPGIISFVEQPDAGDTGHIKLDEPVRTYGVRLDTGRVVWCADIDLEPARVPEETG